MTLELKSPRSQTLPFHELIALTLQQMAHMPVVGPGLAAWQREQLHLDPVAPKTATSRHTPSLVPPPLYKQVTFPTDSFSEHLSRVVESQFGMLSDTLEGNRENTLNTVLYTLGGLAHYGLDEAYIRGRSRAACEVNGLPLDELDKNFQASWDAGTAAPMILHTGDQNLEPALRWCYYARDNYPDIYEATRLDPRTEVTDFYAELAMRPIKARSGDEIAFPLDPRTPEGKTLLRLAMRKVKSYTNMIPYNAYQEYLEGCELASQHISRTKMKTFRRIWGAICARRAWEAKDDIIMAVDSLIMMVQEADGFGVSAAVVKETRLLIAKMNLCKVVAAKPNQFKVATHYIFEKNRVLSEVDEAAKDVWMDYYYDALIAVHDREAAKSIENKEMAVKHRSAMEDLEEANKKIAEESLKRGTYVDEKGFNRVRWWSRVEEHQEQQSESAGGVMSMDRMEHIELIATVAANVKWLSENLEGGVEISMSTRDFDGAKMGINPSAALMFQDWDMRSLADYDSTPGPYLLDLASFEYNTGIALDGDGEIPDDPCRYIDEDEFKRIHFQGGTWEIEFEVRRNPMQEQEDARYAS